MINLQSALACFKWRL